MNEHSPLAFLATIPYGPLLPVGYKGFFWRPLARWY
ncbi:hypothetical protein E1A91_D01G237700v1 [Gossypium mustelinum]|uniref:Uncharacterized protein n=1 Tax=Gossypium mustelinum TaxID=34275 RepID=A0A5D2WA68_GOSMU|nr:hypothetical protein E1A91_D01G237700v1 [Gossypium mustelinum]